MNCVKERLNVTVFPSQFHNLACHFLYDKWSISTHTHTQFFSIHKKKTHLLLGQKRRLPKLNNICNSGSILKLHV